MKVKHLIEQLQALSNGDEIYLASDEEGNNILGIDELVILELDRGVRVPVIYPGSSRIDSTFT